PRINSAKQSQPQNDWGGLLRFARNDESDVPSPPMNTVHGVLMSRLSVLLFAMMSVLVRWLGDRVPLGQVVFFRSAAAILPIALIYAWRGELMSAVRTDRPFGHIRRGHD